MGSRWALRLHALCEWIVWAAAMNALWLLGVTAGGVVFGLGPATTAVAVLTRRRLRGESVRIVPEYARSWRREFFASQVAVGLPLVVAVLITVQAAGRLTAGVDVWAGIVTVAAAYAVVVAAVAPAMHAHYELRARSLAVIASRWVLRNPAPALLLIATAVVIVAVTAALPALALFLSAGTWLTASTALCLGFFAANDAALATTNEGVHP